MHTNEMPTFLPTS